MDELATIAQPAQPTDAGSPLVLEVAFFVAEGHKWRVKKSIRPSRALYLRIDAMMPWWKKPAGPLFRRPEDVQGDVQLPTLTEDGTEVARSRPIGTRASRRRA